MRALRRWVSALTFTVGLAGALPAVAAGSMLQPFAASGSAPSGPWHVVVLPGQKKPFTRF